ncbi:hypothetical protein [Endozoicomonas elysicola]|uniref:hypothetical protein n=1 Tax=Endozoicomonas elysicola TaxID=305900 RepID=UPI00126914D8|nr:hypothetical protein [Endozoicomonas elysicola]
MNTYGFTCTFIEEVIAMLFKPLNRKGYSTSLLFTPILLSLSISAIASPIAYYSNSSLSGVWVYRSFKNDQNLDTEFNKLQFGKGYLTLTIDGGEVTGCIGNNGWQLEISGQKSVRPDGKHTFDLTGKGIVDHEPWQYDYSAQLEPTMHGAQNQALAITGSVLRVLSHSEGKSPAGEVASFTAVKITDTDLIPMDFQCD